MRKTINASDIEDKLATQASTQVPLPLPGRRLRLRGLRRGRPSARHGARRALLSLEGLLRRARARRRGRAGRARPRPRPDRRRRRAADDQPQRDGSSASTDCRSDVRGGGGGRRGRPSAARRSASTRRPSRTPRAPSRRRSPIAATPTPRSRRQSSSTSATHTADYGFAVTPGPSAVFGPITIDGPRPGRRTARGRRRSPKAPLRRAMDIKPGQRRTRPPTIDSATQALLDLGVFSAVADRPDAARARRRPITSSRSR